MKRNNAIILILCLILSASLLIACGSKTAEAPAQTPEQTTAPAPENSGEPAAAETAPAESSEAAEPEAFSYVHDPRDNPQAMKDIIVNPDAVYGFSPSPDSTRLKAYADYDWSDPELVESGRQDRIAYHESLEELYDILFQMREEGKSIEEMARRVSEERNRIRLESYKDDPEGLEKTKQSNLETYGHEEGPLPDELYEKYGSWETVIQKAFGTNPGMDACVGLYDDYYMLYEEIGMDK